MKFLIYFILLINISLFGIDNNNLLENRIFIGDTGIKGEQSEHFDMLNFKNGYFLAKYCQKWGFNTGKYTTKIVDNKVEFEVTLKSKNNGTIFWNGYVQGHALKANFIWSRTFLFWKIQKEYWFDGKEKLKAQ